MVQRLHPNYAALKDAQIIPDEEESATDTVLTAILTKNLQLLHHVLDQTLIRLLRLILIILLQQLLQARIVYLKRLPSFSYCKSRRGIIVVWDW